MTLFELKQAVDEKNAKIEDLIKLNFFTLNKEVQQLNLEINELQQQCAHDYVDGKCKYCGKEQA